MIKPRRLLLLVLGFFVCFGAYEIYSYFLGHYDGLPPLPPEFRYSTATGPTVPKIDDNENRKHEIAKLLERAFGPKCPELNRHRSIEMGGRLDSRTVLAFNDWTLEDGVLKLTDPSVANFKILPPEGNLPAREEIVTVQGSIAVIRFNQPIKSPFEIKPSVKPIAGHIEGDVIKLTHNHGSPEPNDDITVYCKQRVDFVDEQKRIWCDYEVQVVYAFPEEARFVGVGLTIKLANELVAKEGDTLRARTRSDKEKTEGLGISAVKSIQLDRDVQFSFFKLNGSILGGAVGKPDEKPVQTALQQQQQPMVIRCKDAFTYDVPTNVATFNTNVNGLRHRTIATPTGTKQQYDELDADERLVLELVPPPVKGKAKGEKPGAVDENMKQFELKKAVATGKSVKITANEDGQGNGLHAEGIELVVDNVAQEARLRGKDQVVARLMEYDIIAQGIVKILLPASDAEDKDPRGLLINGPGEVRLRPSTAHPDPYTLASWQRELQWHRTVEEHRIELYGNAVLMHEKHGRMSGEQVKAWLMSDKKKTDEKPKTRNPGAATSVERLNAKLKRVEVDQKVQVLSTRLVIPNANRLTLNFTEAPEGFVLQKAADGFDAPAPSPDKSPNLLGKPESKLTNQPPNSPPLYLHAAEIDGDILVVNDNQQLLRRLEARDNVHIERKSEPGKQNGIDIRGQRLEMSLQGNTELYRVKLFGDKAVINNEKYSIEGQQIDLDQTENMLTIDGAGKFRFYTDRDFQGNALIEGRDAVTGQPLKDSQGNIRIKPEQVTFVWNDKMKFGGRVAEFIGSVIAEKGDISLSCHSMTITLDRPMSLSGKEDVLGKQTKDHVVALESVICNSLAQGGVGQRVNPVVIEQRVKPGTPDRNIIRIEGVQVVFDNSTKNKEIIKVFGPGEVNLVRAGQNQLANFGAMPGSGVQGQSQGTVPSGGNPLQLKLTRVLFEQEMEYRKEEGTLRFWKNVHTFHVPGDDVGMPLNEKTLPKEGLYIACEKMTISAIPGPMKTTLHEMQAEGNTEMRANLTSYVKADELRYSEAKGKVVMEGKGGNDALYYNQERPGGKYLVQRAKAFIYDLKTGELSVEQVKSIQIK